MRTGKIRRLNRIFKEDGKALIVAMDHCTYNGANEGLSDPVKALQEIKEGGADAVLLNFGVARQFPEAIAGLGYIARLDLPPTYMRKSHESRLVYDVDYAVSMGADAVIINIGQGLGVEEITFPALAETIQYCDKIGMPVCAEAVPGGFDAGPDFNTLDNIARGARIANEIGCDFMKIRYQEGFERVVKETMVPLVVLGGSRSEDPRDFLQVVYDAMQSGASGVAAGRNIWGYKNTKQMVKAVMGIIHNGLTVDQAYEVLMQN